jgi:hypothetical protein
MDKIQFEYVCCTRAFAPGVAAFAIRADLRLICLLCIILLLATFTPSAIRFYVIGSRTFGQAVGNSSS